MDLVLDKSGVWDVQISCRLRLDAFDEAALAAFMDAYMGRGPEKPVR